MTQTNIGRFAKINKIGSANDGRFAKVIEFVESTGNYRVQFKNNDIRTYAPDQLIFNDKIELGQYVIIDSDEFDYIGDGKPFLAKLIERNAEDGTAKIWVNEFYQEWIIDENDVIKKVLPSHKFEIKVGDYYVAKDHYRTISFTKFFSENNKLTFTDIENLVPNLVDKAKLIEE